MNMETLLYRQIHPSFLQLGRVTSQAFRPTPKDEQRLSVYDGDMVSPRDSYEHYTETQHLQSCGVLGVKYLECEELELPVMPEPTLFTEHAIIDFSQYDKRTTEKKAKQLKNKAIARDWLHRGEGLV